MVRILDRIVTFGRMIKFSHTVFALPFALAVVVIASRHTRVGVEKVGWILAAMVGARTAAMGFNRIVDAELDRRNPRTADRAIPTGEISTKQSAVFVVLAAALLVGSAYRLNELCFALSPVALAIIFFYSFTKRFTSLAHVFLGAALGLAPLGAWIAVTGAWNWAAFVLGLGVLAWVAGFDIIYACQDIEFDRVENLHSIPRRIGVSGALWISRGLHAAAFAVLLGVGYWFDLGGIYYTGVVTVGGLLAYEQSLVHPSDLSKVNVAFFNTNGVISLLYLLFTSVDVLWRS